MEIIIKCTPRYGESLSACYKAIRDMWFQVEPSQRNEIVFSMDFNGYEINTRMSENACYKMILGKSKEEHDAEMKQYMEDSERRERDFKLNMPSFIRELEAKANGRILDEDMSEFREILPVRVADIYHGFEIECLYELIDALNEGGIAKAKTVFESQGHSGMSAGLTASLVQRFHHELGETFKKELYQKDR